ncbi:hypothetical protein TanjilG_32742 [Lupinus angustifolius]|uniref:SPOROCYTELESS-like EAR-containing protein n=1 Tax=Lupinus angustifolius TaxID=3871 RepID=A0A4P1RFC3_LUPAN|nr:PREDICTED: protein SPEAR3-like [Lupinus angustifolius]OIW10002.1 hypothetical protein TanjilG_32742 [Lupinus angustifolius]
MGSSYFGEPNMGNEKGSGSSSSSSSKKGKKSNSDKPKQPQRGLGVAQLEKIRLHGQMAYHPSLHSPYPSNFNDEDPRMQIPPYSSVPSSSSFSYSSSSTSYSPSYGFQPNIVMGLPEYEKSNIRYGDSQPTNTARWENANTSFDNQSLAQSNITRPFLNLHDSQDIDTMRQRSGSGRSRSQNSESSDTQELDLELRLSL